MKCLALSALVALSFACKPQPIDVNVDAAGTERLPLRGEDTIEGTLQKPLTFDGRIIPAGTRVIARETWVLRKNRAANPPGYRITGFYDVENRTEGFVLPTGKVDVYFVCAVLPDNIGSIPVPDDVFLKAP